MAYLRVVSMVINNVGEKEVLLNSRLQIVSITRKMAAANKVSQDLSLSIQIQSANGSLSRIYSLTRNIPFTLGRIIVLLQVHIIDKISYTVFNRKQDSE